ncbi:helix-turn-helix transcriptional regulator [Tsukamurella spumae]|uniref:Helix-turn-helix domain-containing protein n=1 Tax=Tsukamurella spumae TaxID=44753 RepID=A0A846WVN0_9ACTN|nr:helix-turn-helix domain-containing protein [Tsukamurella spumae]NKY16991.1 helix-turn-helix domain-containing protein [Tsukamurella spumae]
MPEKILREKILRHVRATREAHTVAGIAGTTGIPSSTVRFHLHALAEDGLVEATPAPSDGPGRPSMLYRARPAMDPSGPREFALLARLLVDVLGSVPDATERARRSGRAWGAERARSGTDPVEDLVGLLDAAGFAPERHAAGIRLNRCPFLEVARRRPGVTCAVHRGMIEGVLGAHDAGVELVDLEAFLSGDHCLATISSSPPRG